MVGRVQSEIDNGRHAVELDGGKIVSIKPCNLSLFEKKVQEDKIVNEDKSPEENGNIKPDVVEHKEQQ